jgi:hypothetical protein
MRFRHILAAFLVMLSGLAVVQAQSYPGERDQERSSVIRPASTTMWRNYVTVPDGPCGCPMSVQADCYNPTCRPCGPLHPICFSKRVVRMLDCVLPCNLCCGGGHGLFGGCLGGKTWGNCSICCGGSGCGSCGGCTSCGPSCGSGCCPNPAGSVFDGVACCVKAGCTSPGCTSCINPSCTTPSCTSGGHCFGCSDAAAPPGLTDPFQDDPLPQPSAPRPTSATPTEVRRAPTSRLKPVSAPAKEPVAAAPQASPYKIVSKPGTAAATTKPAIMSKPAAPPSSATTSSRRRVAEVPAVEEIRVAAPAKPALRAASAESPINEPAPHRINHARTAPIARSQTAEYKAGGEVPSNPLR